MQVIRCLNPRRELTTVCAAPSLSHVRSGRYSLCRSSPLVPSPIGESAFDIETLSSQAGSSRLKRMSLPERECPRRPRSTLACSNGGTL